MAAASPIRLFRSHTAFSLIELLLVLGIVGVMTAVAVPSYVASIGRYHLDAAARRIVTDFELARSQAITTSQSQSIVFAPATDSYQLPGIAALNRKSATYTVELRLDPYQATLVSASFGGTATATFDAYGAASSGGTVVIQVGAAQKTVVLDGDSGKASVQ